MTKKIAIIAIFLLIPFVGHAQTVKPTREQLLAELSQLQAELIALLQASGTPATSTPLVGTPANPVTPIPVKVHGDWPTVPEGMSENCEWNIQIGRYACSIGA